MGRTCSEKGEPSQLRVAIVLTFNERSDVYASKVSLTTDTSTVKIATYLRTPPEGNTGKNARTEITIKYTHTRQMYFLIGTVTTSCGGDWEGGKRVASILTMLAFPSEDGFESQICIQEITATPLFLCQFGRNIEGNFGTIKNRASLGER